VAGGPPRRRVVLVGATGMFGARLAARLATWPQLDLVLAARSAGPPDALRARLEAAGARAALSAAVVDRDRPQTVMALAPWAVIDAAGPFQGATYALAQAVLEAGAHWIDLADARGYVAGFAVALDGMARARGVLAVTAASSTPALSSAALARLTDGWREVRRATTVIAPAAQSPGLSVAQAMLAQAGQAVRCFTGGAWTTRRAWMGARWVSLPGLGRRLAALADTPDLDMLLVVAREQALFLASIEPPILTRLLGLAAWAVRLRLLPSLRPLAPALRPIAAWLARFGARRGGMTVTAEGVGPEGEPRRARWSLIAEGGSGPDIPSAPASAVLRAVLDDRLERTGAQVCVGVVELSDILAEMAGLPIATRLETWRLDRTGLFPCALGEAFDDLPPTVREVHAGAARRLEGRVVSAGRGPGAWLASRALGLPGRGHFAAEVEIAPAGDAEVWTRRFGGHRFRSRLQPLADRPGQFEERLGPAAFAFSLRVTDGGFAWVHEGWRLGPFSMPMWLGPICRGRCLERDGTYRFSAIVAHRWLGVLVAYAGRLRPAAET
jgi:Domain of unknown function (DUF4166)/Semialdehyde dehydrogenase, NAD binding domain